KLRVKPGELFATDREISKRFVKVALPVMASGTSWGIAMGLQTAILGRLEDSVITANSIASTVFQIMSVFIYGSATASSVMIGKTIGKGASLGSPDALRAEIRHRAGRMQLVFLCLGTVTGIGLYLCRPFILSFYDISAGTRDLAMQFMAVLSVTVVGTAYQMACLTGIVRGGGDTRFVFINDLIFMWGIILPSSFLAAFFFKFPPVVIFFCLKADQILKCAVAVVKVNRYRWVKKI
ncbi:MAG: MATE family efflux transporter, partial [Clostridia bacterium]|nr:MATE family efflux transporter [Clostridia bacterium]